MIYYFLGSQLPLVGEYNTEETTLYNTSFPGTSLPANFVASGWSVNNGLSISTGGGYGTRAYLNKNSTLDRAIVECVITAVSGSSTFGLFRQATLAGTLVEIREGKEIVVYASWDTANNAPTPVFVKKLETPLVGGQDYTLQLKKVGGALYFTVRNAAGALMGSVMLKDSYSPFVGSFWGNPGVMYRAGSIAVKSFAFKNVCPQAPRVAIYGDSYVDGFTTRTNTEGYQSRWAAKVWNRLHGDCLISGKGGDDSAGLLTRTDLDLDMFNPDFVIFAIGFNDSVYSTWLANITSLISKAEARGATVVLSTFPPRSDRQSFLNSANSYIRASGRPYVDFAKALTTSEDSLNWISSYLLSDGVHPTATGHQVMYNRLLADVPQIFV